MCVLYMIHLNHVNSAIIVYEVEQVCLRQLSEIIE